MICKVFYIEFFLLSVSFSEITLYDKNRKELNLNLEDHCLDGAIDFHEPQNFTCICVQGIYSFFNQKCSSPIVIEGGDDYCFKIPNKLTSRIEFLSRRHGHYFSIMDPTTSAVRARYNSKMEYPYFKKGDSVLVVQSWTIVLKDGTNVCLHVPEEKYCIYNKVSKFVAIRPGCHGAGKISFKPSVCMPIKLHDDPSSTECTPKSRTRRSVIRGRSNVNSNGQKGRVFLTASRAMNPVVLSTVTNETDEDYGISGANGSDIIKSQIYNYIITRAASITNPTGNSKPKTYKTPAFQILDLAKQVIQKSCPKFYIPDEHWNMAVGSFISMQQKSFKFRETFVDLPEIKRIKEALEKCRDNITEPWPFVDPTNATQCDANGQPTNPKSENDTGVYSMFETQLVINVPYNLSSRSHEPIIETNWKVFNHAHKRCYEFFNERYNDHHRFTEMLMPLFQNDALDHWTFNNTGEKLTKDIYAGLLGDAIYLMDKVDSCAFAALESAYPWELSRPKVKKVYPSGFRRRRSTADTIGEIGKCSSLIENAEIC